MPNTDKRHRKEVVLRRFAYVGPTLTGAYERQAASRTEAAWCALVEADPIGSRILSHLGASLIAVVRSAGTTTDSPVLGELHRACAMFERSWPDIDGTPRRDGRPHPLVVLALDRLLHPKYHERADRDVTAWALWTYCQVPKTGRRGHSRWVDIGDAEIRVIPELIGLAAEADVLSIPAMAAAFGPGTLHRAIARIDKLVTRAGKEATPPVL